jgi:hypothetical protein
VANNFDWRNKNERLHLKTRGDDDDDDDNNDDDGRNPIVQKYAIFKPYMFFLLVVHFVCFTGIPYHVSQQL